MLATQTSTYLRACAPVSTELPRRSRGREWPPRNIHVAAAAASRQGISTSRPRPRRDREYPRRGRGGAAIRRRNTRAARVHLLEVAARRRLEHRVRVERRRDRDCQRAAFDDAGAAPAVRGPARGDRDGQVRQAVQRLGDADALVRLPDIVQERDADGPVPDAVREARDGRDHEVQPPCGKFGQSLRRFLARPAASPAIRLHGISTSQPQRRRDPSPRSIHVPAAASLRPVRGRSTSQPRRRRDPSPRIIPHPGRRRCDPSAEDPRRSRGVARRPRAADRPRAARALNSDIVDDDAAIRCERRLAIARRRQVGGSPLARSRRRRDSRACRRPRPGGFRATASGAFFHGRGGAARDEAVAARDDVTALLRGHVAAQREEGLEHFVRLQRSLTGRARAGGGTDNFGQEKLILWLRAR